LRWHIPFSFYHIIYFSLSGRLQKYRNGSGRVAANGSQVYLVADVFSLPCPFT